MPRRGLRRGPGTADHRHFPEADTNKKVDTGFIEKALELEKSNPAMIAAIPYALTAIEEGDVSMVSSEIPAIMSRNLIHNQSILTDTIILGFPFHYFYSALFLLVLFVTICVVYCRAIDKVMAKYELEKTFE